MTVIDRRRSVTLEGLRATGERREYVMGQNVMDQPSRSIQARPESKVRSDCLSQGAWASQGASTNQGARASRRSADGAQASREATIGVRRIQAERRALRAAQVLFASAVATSIVVVGAALGRGSLALPAASSAALRAWSSSGMVPALSLGRITVMVLATAWIVIVPAVLAVRMFGSSSLRTRLEARSPRSARRFIDEIAARPPAG